MIENSTFLNLEQELKRALDRHLRDKTGNRVPTALSESIYYSLLGPGKRIRPRLALACGRMIGLPQAPALAGAIALEMVHCYTLIHDDLPCMDNDDFRRGRPSNHKQFGEAIALLAGDSLIPLAIEALLDAASHVASENLVRALRRLAWAMGPRAVIAGQAAEMELTARSSIEDLRRMHAQKTGALFSAALLLPADLAGLREEDPRFQAIDQFSRELGLAFQVADDLEDAHQDVIPGTANESVAPNNILFYLPDHDARMLTIDGLNRAKNTLLCSWEKGAEPLALIADEICKRLGAPA